MEEIYRRALYCVGGEQGFVLRVGVFSAALANLYRENRCSTAVFLTAANPGGVKLSDSVNIQAQQRLKRHLLSSGWKFLPGIGLDSDPTSDWPGEPSLLILGISYHEAFAMGVSFKQLAIVWCPATAVPELVMLKQI